MKTAPSPADLLFDDLVHSQERITYKAAYLALVGPVTHGWNPSLVREVVRIVEQSRQLTVGGLSVRLDALVVNDRAPSEPSAPHFRGKAYTRSQWQAVFGSWGVRRASV